MNSPTLRLRNILHHLVVPHLKCTSVPTLKIGEEKQVIGVLVISTYCSGITEHSTDDLREIVRTRTEGFV